MISRELWAQAWPEYEKLKKIMAKTYPRYDPRRYLLLCFSCLEKRLDRRLTLDDFDANIPVNKAVHFGYFLRVREEGL